MADDHDHGHDVHFESADAGASLTYPQQAGTVRKNGFLVIKGRPCKVCCTGGLCRPCSCCWLLDSALCCTPANNANSECEQCRICTSNISYGLLPCYSVRMNFLLSIYASAGC